MIATISQPIKGYKDEEIIESRNRAIDFLKSRGFKFADNFFSNDMFVSNIYGTDVRFEKIDNENEMNLLVKSLNIIIKCTTIYFCKGWRDEPKCRIEHQVAVEYGLEIIYEEDVLRMRRKYDG